jgi:hypothetical protein
LPATAFGSGVPEICGAVFVTLIEKAGSAALSWPSLTPIETFEYTRRCAAPGVPRSSPVAGVNVAHSGAF